MENISLGVAPSVYKPMRRIAFTIHTGLWFAYVPDIMYLKAEGSYVSVYLRDGKRILLSKSLNAVEPQLDAYQELVRVHRSYVVNLDHMDRYLRQRQSVILLHNGIPIPVSQRRKGAIEELFMEIFQF